MRSVIAALAIVALLAIRMITHRDDAGPNTALTGRAVTPVTMPGGPALPVANQAFEPTIPDETISDAETIGGSIEANVSSDRAVQIPAIEFDSEQRIKIVEYLSKSGLAVADSERIADAALVRSKECIAEAFGTNAATSTSIETCMFNVLAAYGLNGATD
jgi:hypothetical protein